MVKVFYLALTAIAVTFVLSLIGCPSIATMGSKVATEIGEYIAAEEASQVEAEHQRHLQAEIEAGRIVRVVMPDGRVVYRNAFAPAPDSADSLP